MFVEIDKPVTTEKVLEASGKIQHGKGEKSLRNHFGKLKRGFEAVTYQKSVRNDWD